MTAFDKHQVSRFRFVRCEFAADTGVAKLVYAFDDGPEMVETITVPGAPFMLDEARTAAVQRALQLLHLIAGVSYYKAGVPETVSIDSYAIDADTAALVETVYLNGLGEFAYRNGLNLRGRFRLPVQGEAVQAPVLGLQPHALVAMLVAAAQSPDNPYVGGRLSTIDGLRVDFPDGWGLVRASNTTPVLVLRFEAETDAELTRIQEVFRAQLYTVAPDLKLPF